MSLRQQVATVLIHGGRLAALFLLLVSVGLAQTPPNDQCRQPPWEASQEPGGCTFDEKGVCQVGNCSGTFWSTAVPGTCEERKNKWCKSIAGKTNQSIREYKATCDKKACECSWVETGKTDVVEVGDVLGESCALPPSTGRALAAILPSRWPRLR
jgi:hypothetical protein